MPMKNPPHPRDLIRTEVIEALGLSVSKAAAILKVGRATLPDLLHGKAALTPEMALRFEKAFGRDMDHFSGCSSPVTWRRHESTHWHLDQTICPGLKRAARISYMFENGFRRQSRSMSVHREGRS